MCNVAATTTNTTKIFHKNESWGAEDMQAASSAASPRNITVRVIIKTVSSSLEAQKKMVGLGAAMQRMPNPAYQIT